MDTGTDIHACIIILRVSLSFRLTRAESTEQFNRQQISGIYGSEGFKGLVAHQVTTYCISIPQFLLVGHLHLVQRRLTTEEIEVTR